jgi:23S rRNA (cytosine1962-C5)-methyltransferase
VARGRTEKKRFEGGGGGGGGGPVDIETTAAAAAQVRRGHPWVYRDRIVRGLDRCAPGDVRIVRGPDGEPCGVAVIDPGSPLAARIWSPDPSFRLDVASLRGKLEGAIARREAFVDGARTNALRWVHGEGDRMPGVVVDRYADVLVLRLDGAGIAHHLPALVDALETVARRRDVRSIALRSTARGEAEVEKLSLLWGDPTPEEIRVEEHGVPFVVDLARGQKTGAFLDQRENRRRVGALSRGRRVLNLFSYAGGFSIHAALGGATAVTSVDVAAKAHVTAQKSFHAAGVPLEPHEFVTADVFRFLEQARARGQRWDLVISDPPNMAPNEQSRPRALSAYRKLHGACAAVLAEGGIFCAASCSSHVGLEDFLSTLDDMALGRADLRVLEIAGAGPDHPVLPGFPEGRYLEFCVLA